MVKRARAADAPAGNEVFIPDLCGVNALYVVVITSELVALVIVIAGTGFGPRFVDDLALVSIYTQWLGLSTAAALCVARGALRGRDERTVALTSFGLILFTATVVAELAWWVVNPVVGAGAIITLSHVDLLTRTITVSAIVGALALRYFYVQFHWQQRIASEASARLEALQARIRPHFFFNCMNTIASLTRTAPAAAERAVLDLADLFRASLADAGELVSLDEECAFVERYLGIEHLRLGARLTVEWRRDGSPATVRLPRLTLQPIVENAIYHGIEPRSAGGTIVIGVRAVGRACEITVENPLPDGVAEPPARAGNQLALDNVRQRLGAHFGDDGRLEVARVDGIFRVTLRVPLAAAV